MLLKPIHLFDFMWWKNAVILWFLVEKEKAYKYVSIIDVWSSVKEAQIYEGHCLLESLT